MQNTDKVKKRCQASTFMSWRHSGFSVHNGVRVSRDDEKGREALARYIIRNTFSIEKLHITRKSHGYLPF